MKGVLNRLYPILHIVIVFTFLTQCGLQASHGVVDLGETSYDYVRLQAIIPTNDLLSSRLSGT